MYSKAKGTLIKCPNPKLIFLRYRIRFRYRTQSNTTIFYSRKIVTKITKIKFKKNYIHVLTYPPSVVCCHFPFPVMSEACISPDQLVILNYFAKENLNKMLNCFKTVHKTLSLTSLSSADGPPSGTLISSRCKSCGALIPSAWCPCGRPIGPANAPNCPANPKPGIDDWGGAPGICWAWICC